MENNERAKIYEIAVDRNLPAFMGVIGALIAGAFLTWYCFGIVTAVSGDINSFPAAFRSNPVLTIFFAVLKFGAYILFPFIAATWVYIPIRDFVVRKRVQGRLGGVSDFPGMDRLPLWARVPFLGWFLSWGMPVPGRSAMKNIRLDTREIQVPLSPVLSQVLSQENIAGKELVFLLGAFNRVLSIELVP